MASVLNKLKSLDIEQMDIFSNMKNNEINITKLKGKHPERIKVQQDKKRSMSTYTRYHVFTVLAGTHALIQQNLRNLYTAMIPCYFLRINFCMLAFIG